MASAGSFALQLTVTAPLDADVVTMTGAEGGWTRLICGWLVQAAMPAKAKSAANRIELRMGSLCGAVYFRRARRLGTRSGMDGAPADRGRAVVAGRRVRRRDGEAGATG